MIHPIKFNPILKPVLWGGEEICHFKGLYPVVEGIGESWEISQLKDHVSIVSDGALQGLSLNDLMARYGARLLGKSVESKYKDQFPLLVKFIDAHDNLSIQVHPDNALAKIRHGSSGKTEMWYVISAEEGAGLYSGFSRKITPEEYVKRVSDDTIMDVLQFHQVKSGDVFFLPAGCIHAIGKGVFVAEIQQPSDITYRIYDYKRRDVFGKERELHTDLAKDAIDFNLYEDLKINYELNKEGETPLISCPYFDANLLNIGSNLERSISIDSFVIYIVIEGQLVITDREGYKTEMKQGETVLIPAEAEMIVLEALSESAKILECHIPG